MNSSYLTDITARSHRDDLQREAAAARSSRRERRRASKGQNDYGETRHQHGGRLHTAWTWLATAQI